MTEDTAEARKTHAAVKMTQQRPPPVVDDGDDDNILSEFDSDLARLDSEAEAILNSIRNETSESRPRSETSSPMQESASDGGYSSSPDEQDDMHDDDEMNDEILRLGSVVASLQQDLDNMNVDVATVTNTKKSTLESPVASAPPLPESVESDAVVDLIQSKEQYSTGTGGNEVSIPLVFVNLLVWAAVIVLAIHVRSGSLDEDGGGFAFLPSFGAT